MIRNHVTEDGYHYKISLLADGKFHIQCIDSWAYTYGQYTRTERNCIRLCAKR